MMETVVISHEGADLYAWELDGRWTVRLGAFEASSSYLDLALAEVLEHDEGIHELAAKVVAAVATGAGEPVAA